MTFLLKIYGLHKVFILLDIYLKGRKALIQDFVHIKVMKELKVLFTV